MVKPMFLIILATVCIKDVLAFPHYAKGVNFQHLEREIDAALEGIDIQAIQKEAKQRLLSKRASTWSPSQLIDVTGNHRWIAPTAAQTRGPCPALNAMANHGYLDRSGKTNLVEALAACQQVLGFGPDFALVTVVSGIVFGGNPLDTSWSIGRSLGPPVLLPGVLSPPGGLDQTHNAYESDGSPTRADSFLNNGDVWTLKLDRFKHLYGLQPNAATADYNYDVIAQHKSWTLQNSISQNPRFFFAPLAGLIVANGAHLLIPACFSNHSAEKPDGYLDQATLTSFFGVQGTTLNTLTYQSGHERIPDNWYKRPTPLTIPEITTKLLDLINAVPGTAAIGGNTGQVNTFTGVNVADLTGGALNAQTLLEGNNLFCFAFAAARAGLPTFLGGIASLIGATLAFLDSKINPILQGLDCPELNQINLSLFNQFPGSN